MRLDPLIAIAIALSAPMAAGSSGAAQDPARATERPSYYRPRLAVAENLEPFVKQVAPGHDAFPEELEAEELSARLAELGGRLKQSPDRASEVADFLLAPTFRGARLRPNEGAAIAQQSTLQIQRAGTLSQEPVLDSRSFTSELRGLLTDFRQVTVAEFLITSIDLKRDEGLANTSVRYDIVGPGKDAWRVEQSGVWRMRWRKSASASWARRRGRCWSTQWIIMCRTWPR